VDYSGQYNILRAKKKKRAENLMILCPFCEDYFLLANTPALTLAALALAMAN